MPRIKLTKEQELTICRQYESNKMPIKNIAFLMGVSPRTVGRVLAEHKLPTKQQEFRQTSWKFHQLLKKYEITEVKQLDTILKAHFSKQEQLDLRAQQELSVGSVQQFLNACRPEQLASLFYTAGLIKIAEMHNGSVMNATLQFQKEAQKGKVNYGNPISGYKPFRKG